jgi:hypothetical protein
MWLDKYDLTSAIEERERQTDMAFVCCNTQTFENQSDSSHVKLFDVGVIYRYISRIGPDDEPSRTLRANFSFSYNTAAYFSRQDFIP